MPPLTPEQKHIVEKNIRLVAFTIQKYVSPAAVQMHGFDDLFQSGCVGLVRAAATFRSSSGNQFSTYATRCILNAVYGYMRPGKAKCRTGKVISLDASIQPPKAEKPCTVADTLHDRETTETRHSAHEILRFLSQKAEQSEDTRRILRGMLAGKTQQQIAEEIGLSQSVVCRKMKKIRQSVRSFQNGEGESL